MINPVVKIPLNDNWYILQGEKVIKLTCNIPETVFEALIKNGIISDPFYGNEEQSVAWVYESEWIYEKWFDLDTKLLSYSNIKLRFYGLDTCTEVLFNGKSLGKTENMFRTYEFDIKQLAKSSDNHLKIKFTSPIKATQEKKQKWKDNLTTGLGTAIPGVPYLRKAQYSFGWDWGPKLPDIGIWKSIEIICSDGLLIESIHPRTYYFYDKDQDTQDNSYPEIKVVKLETDIMINNENSHSYILQVRVISPSGKEYMKNIVTGKIEETIEFLIEEPELWWTHDLGEPLLHTLEVSIAEKDTIIDTKSLTIGLRDVHLVREKDEWGESFYFRLNGLPLFAKGANWIPIDSFIPRGQKLGLYSMNLQFAQNANFNYIRVWGGGIYEMDEFYDFCDQMGLLIWQDFPYACAMYPLFDTEFLNNAMEEAKQNIISLRHHASLALWCGNNEIEVYFNGLILLTSRGIVKKRKYKKYYIKFFEEILPRLVNQYDHQHDYWPSSPSNGGFLSDFGGGLIKSLNNEYGDKHYWSVWHGGRSFESYRKQDSRFMSEYGFESFPHMRTLLEFCPPEQMDMFSPIMENHQKNSAGNKKILKYMKERFSIPTDFGKQVILSQITQAEAMKYGVEHWRRNRNNNHCMGSLYWQLNDCWPVASWSSLDYYGRWKALHYFARRFYAPILPTILEFDDYIEFWVSNDTKFNQKVSISYAVCNAEDVVVARDEALTGEFHLIPALSSKLVIVQEIKTKTIGKKQQMIFVSIKDEIGQLYENFHLLGKPKDFAFKKSTFQLKLLEEEVSSNSCRVKIENDNLAAYVFFESNKFDIIPSDNYFSMQASSAKEVMIKLNPFIHKNTKITAKEIFDSLEVKSLWNLRD